MDKREAELSMRFLRIVLIAVVLLVFLYYWAEFTYR